jgi:hypothetical protein
VLKKCLLAHSTLRLAAIGSVVRADHCP